MAKRTRASKTVFTADFAEGAAFRVAYVTVAKLYVVIESAQARELASFDGDAAGCQEALALATRLLLDAAIIAAQQAEAEALATVEANQLALQEAELYSLERSEALTACIASSAPYFAARSARAQLVTARVVSPLAVALDEQASDLVAARAAFDVAETRTPAEIDADHGRDRDAGADEAPYAWEQIAAVGRFQLVRTPTEILLTDTHDGRVVERFAADSAALAQQEADLLNRHNDPDAPAVAVLAPPKRPSGSGAVMGWSWDGNVRELAAYVRALRSEVHANG